MTYNSDLPDKEKSEDFISIGALIEDENEFDDHYQIDDKNHLQVKMTPEQQERLRLAKESGLKTPFGEGEVIIEEPVHKEDWFDIIWRRNKAILEQQFEEEVYGTNLDIIASNLHSDENEILGPNLGAVLGNRERKEYEDVYKSEIGSDNYHKEDMGEASFSGDSFIYQYKHNSNQTLNQSTDSNKPYVPNETEIFVKTQDNKADSNSIFTKEPNTHLNNDKYSDTQDKDNHPERLVANTLSLVNKLKEDQNIDHKHTHESNNELKSNNAFLSSSINRALDDPYYIVPKEHRCVDPNDYTTYHNNFTNDDAKQAFNDRQNYQYDLDEATKAARELKSLNPKHPPKSNYLDNIITNSTHKDNLRPKNAHNIFYDHKNIGQYLIPDNPCYVLDKNSMPLMPVNKKEAQILLDCKIARSLEPDLLMLNLAIGDLIPNIDMAHSILEHCFALPEPSQKLLLSIDIDKFIVFNFLLDNQIIYQEIIEIPKDIIDSAQEAKEQFGMFDHTEPLYVGSTVNLPYKAQLNDDYLNIVSFNDNYCEYYDYSNTDINDNTKQDSNLHMPNDNVAINALPYNFLVNDESENSLDKDKDNSNQSNTYYKDLYENFAFTIAKKITRLRKVLPIQDVAIGAMKFDFTKILR